MNLDRDYRYYQADADDAIYNYLCPKTCPVDEEPTKCGVHKFCGTGKSLLMRNGKINEGRTLIAYVFPSLSLIDQFTTDYLFDRPSVSILKVSSELESTTDVGVIHDFLMRDLQKYPKIICVTYQSYQTLLNCLVDAGMKISVAHFDEAHHAVGQTYQKLIFENDLCEKQVFYTATPKNANGIVMRDREHPQNNMCGPWVYDYTYLDGVNDGYLNPFEIRIDLSTQNTNKSIFESISRAAIASGNSRILTFHSDVSTDRDTSVLNFVDEAEFIRTHYSVLKAEFPKVKKNRFKKIHMIALTADTPLKCKSCRSKACKASCVIKPTSKSCCRFNILNYFDACPDDELVVLSSCETIGEGIDTKNANMCVFVDPKSSHVKIIQNIGRIVRKQFGEDKPRSTILIPCWVDADKYAGINDGDDGEEGEDRNGEGRVKEKRDEIIRQDMDKSGNFNGILNVMSALKQEDEDLYELCLHYPDTYSPQEIQNNLSQQGYMTLEPFGDGGICDTLVEVLDDMDVDDIEDLDRDEDVMMYMADKNDVCIEVHTNSLETPIVRYNPEASGQTLRLLRDEIMDDGLVCESDESDCDTDGGSDGDENVDRYSYKQIVPKNQKRDTQKKLDAPKKNKRLAVNVHTNPDVRVLWNVVDGLDVSKEICSCVIDCEVVQYDPVEVAEGIVLRAEKRVRQGGSLLPQHIPKNNQNTPELVQEKRDAQKLGCWKKTLKGKKGHKCSDEVRDYLDENLPGWRDELDAKAMEDAISIVGRTKERELQGKQLLPRQIPKNNRNTPELVQENKDALKLHDWKMALKGKGKSKCCNEVRDYLDENLSRWRDELDFDAKAMEDAVSIVERAKERELQGKQLLPRSIRNTQDRTTPELVKEYQDATKLGSWKKALKGKGSSRCCDEVRDYLDEKLSGWRDKLDFDTKAMEDAVSIVERAKERELQGKQLLPRSIRNTQDRTTPELVKENQDAIKLGNWKSALKGSKNSKCSNEVRDYLDEKLSGWRDELDFDAKAMEDAMKMVERAKERELQGKQLLPRSIRNTQDRTTPELVKENQDALKLGHWKQALKGKGSSKCCDEVRDYLDEKLSGWRNEKVSKKSMSLSPTLNNQGNPNTENQLTQEEQRAKVKSELSVLHQRYKTLTSANLAKEFAADPQLWIKYHAIAEQNEETFPDESIPRNVIISRLEKIKTRRTKSVIDLGCGRAHIAAHFAKDKRFEFTNYDHVADPAINVNADDAVSVSVSVCDISQLPLEDDSMEIAILSLAMWGSNCHDYVREAYRVLETRGWLYIIEPTKRWTTIADQTQDQDQDQNANAGSATELVAGDKLQVLLENTGFRVMEKMTEKFSLFVCVKG